MVAGFHDVFDGGSPPERLAEAIRDEFVTSAGSRFVTSRGSRVRGLAGVLAAAEILHRFGGVFAMPGSRLTGDLTDITERAAAWDSHGLVLADAGGAERSMKVMGAVARSTGIRALLDELRRRFAAPHLEPADIDRIVAAGSPGSQALEALLGRGRTRAALDRAARSLRGPGADRTWLPVASRGVVTFPGEAASRVRRPVPDPGAPAVLPPGFAVQEASDGSTWVAARDVPELPGATDWAGLLRPGALHVGTPGDEAAGRPVLSAQEVRAYIEGDGVPDGSKPGQVVVHRHVDGQAWASLLNAEVRVRPGPADRPELRDQSGQRYDPLVTGHVFTPFTPAAGVFPPQPGLVAGALEKLVRDGLITRVEGLPWAFMLPARDGAPAHSLELAPPGGLIIRPGPPVRDEAWRAAQAGQPAGTIIAHIDPEGDRSAVDRVLDLLPVPRGLVTEQPMTARLRPVPGDGRLFSVQEAPDGDWLAARAVWPLTGSAAWAGRGRVWTLHVGTPGDAEAGLPLLSWQDVSDAIPGLRTRPARVVVHRPIDDGQAWASHLGLPVFVPAGQPGADGKVRTLDPLGNLSEPLAAGLVFTPAAPGSAPDPPGLWVIQPLTRRLRDGGGGARRNPAAQCRVAAVWCADPPRPAGARRGMAAGLPR